MAMAQTKMKNRLPVTKKGQFLLVALLSIFSVLIFQNPASAAEWKDQNTIVHDGREFKGPRDHRIRIGDTTPHGYFAEGDERGCRQDVIYFDKDVDNPRQAETAQYGTDGRSNGGMVGGCSRDLQTITVSADGTGGGAGSGEEGSDGEEPTCSAGAVGWVVCPLITASEGFMMAVADMIGNVLDLNPLSFNAKDPIFKAWQNILVFANLVLVIAFLLIIFSQATSFGLSSYGIKSMLPRVIAAAIMMNLSYFIAAIMVDASNIVGAGISGLLLSTTDGIDIGGGSNGIGAQIGEVVGGVAALAIGVGVAAGLVILVLLNLVPAAIILLVFFLLLGARIAIVTLLVMIAPLAFAAWILPNTEKYFKKWLDLFVQMLVIYPIFMALFAGAVVASRVVAEEAATGDTSNWMVVMALIILVTPIFAIPFVLRTSSSALDKIGRIAHRSAMKYGGQQASGLYKNAAKRQMQNTGAKMANNRWGYDENGNPIAGRGKRFQRGLGKSAAFMGGYKTRRDFKISSQEREAKRMQEDALADRLLVNGGDNRLVKGAQGVAGDAARERVMSSAVALQEKRTKEETENAMASMRANNVFSPNDLSILARGQALKRINPQTNQEEVVMDGGTSESIRRAAMQQIIGNQDAAAMTDVFKHDDAGVQQMMYEEVQKMYPTAKGAGAHFVGLQPKAGGYTDEDLQMAAAQSLSRLSWQKLAAQDGPSVEYAAAGLVKLVQQKGVAGLSKDEGVMFRELYDAAAKAHESPEILGNAKKGVRQGLADILELGNNYQPPQRAANENIAGTPPSSGGPLVTGEQGSMNVRGSQQSPPPAPNPSGGDFRQDPNSGLWTPDNHDDDQR